MMHTFQAAAYFVASWDEHWTVENPDLMSNNDDMSLSGQENYVVTDRFGAGSR